VSESNSVFSGPKKNCLQLERTALSGFGLRRKEDIMWLSLEACDLPELGWRDTDS
jgi:hypothetical protein